MELIENFFCSRQHSYWSHGNFKLNSQTHRLNWQTVRKTYVQSSGISILRYSTKNTSDSYLTCFNRKRRFRASPILLIFKHARSFWVVTEQYLWSDILRPFS